MLGILQKKEINKGRQYNLDLLKAIAIVCMIVCHAVMRFGEHIPDHRSHDVYMFATVVLGSYIAVAHAFMFCMGVGMAYSQKSTPMDLFKRGLRLYVLAYILNFFRYSVYIIAEGLIVGSFRSELMYSLYTQDILQFAGLALMLTALFKKLKLSSLVICVIAAAMSVAGSVLAFTSTGVVAWDVLLGSFFTTTISESHFALLSWYLFVALGMLFGDVIRRVENLDRFWAKTMILSGVVMAVYIALTMVFGRFFLSKNHFYYAVSIPEAMGFLSIDLFIASVCYFIQKRVPKDALTVWINMSKNVNAIYVIHWCIIGFVEAIFCYLLGFVFPYWFSYLFGCVLVVVSYVLSMVWTRRRYRGNYVK